MKTIEHSRGMQLIQLNWVGSLSTQKTFYRIYSNFIRYSKLAINTIQQLGNFRKVYDGLQELEKDFYNLVKIYNKIKCLVFQISDPRNWSAPIIFFIATFEVGFRFLEFLFLYQIHNLSFAFILLLRTYVGLLKVISSSPNPAFLFDWSTFAILLGVSGVKVLCNHFWIDDFGISCTSSRTRLTLPFPKKKTNEI